MSLAKQTAIGIKQVFFLVLTGLLATSMYTTIAEGKPTHTDDDTLPALEFEPGLAWLNVTRPLTLDDLRGKVVILDFWTYGCINCMHIITDLRRLEEKYGNRLAVIGVHSPKFDNEANLETLRSIVVRYDREHPIVNDVDFTLMRAYGVRAWPTLIVINPAGGVEGSLKGEGHYKFLNKIIAGLLDKFQAIVDPGPLPISLEKDRFAQSLLAAPGKVAVSTRHIAISDTLHHRVIVTDHDGKINTIYGGMTAGLTDGPAGSARFSSPQGLAFSNDGLYVADTGNHTIRYIDLSEKTVTTVAGTGRVGLRENDEYLAMSVNLRSPWDLALHNHHLYIAMAGTHQIWRFDLRTNKIAPYAGSGREGLHNGPADVATFSQPSGLSIDGKWLYVADAESSAIRRVFLEDGRVETLVGTGLFDFGDRDGPFRTAMLQHVLGVTALNGENILIADTYNHKLKRLNLKEGTVKTLAGTGDPGRAVGDPTVSQLNEPGGVAILGQRVLIADTNNHRILTYDLLTKRLEEWPLTP
ncbi:MAG: redoxin domain-containing protein [Gammaproteobacteria bacterium]|nr:redoxin domain-containing protein [Gammaproteobacteria bacterium]